jgi:hypothetical protein
VAWHRWQRLAALAIASHHNGRQPSVTLGSLAASGSGNWRKSSPEKQRQAAKIIGQHGSGGVMAAKSVAKKIIKRLAAVAAAVALALA